MDVGRWFNVGTDQMEQPRINNDATGIPANGGAGLFHFRRDSGEDEGHNDKAEQHRRILDAGNGLVVGPCLYGCDAMKDWLESRFVDYEIPEAIIGVVRGGKVVGAVGFSHWQKENGDIVISCCGDSGWFSREVFTQCFMYAFDTLKVQRVSSHVLGNNEAALSLNRRLPFVKEGIRRRAVGGVDQWLFRMDEKKAKKSRWWKTEEKRPKAVSWVFSGKDIKVVEL